MGEDRVKGRFAKGTVKKRQRGDGTGIACFTEKGTVKRNERGGNGGEVVRQKERSVVR